MTLRRLLFAAALLWSVAGFPASAQARSITITSPSNNATNLYCLVKIQASVVHDTGDSYFNPAKIKITNSAGTVVVNNAVMTQLSNTQWEYDWQSLTFPNGTYYLQASYGYRAANGTMGSVVSASNLVTVKNGYDVSSDATETYAKVLSPADKSTVDAPEAFTVSTEHKITWVRHDDCGNYTVNYRFRQETSWQTTLTRKYDPPSGQPPYSLTLPKQKADISILKSMANTYPSGLPHGDFSAEAWSETPDGNTVAHGASTFTIIP